MRSLSVLIFCAFAFASCGDNSNNNTSSDRDTAAVSTSDTQSALAEDTSTQGTNLMTPMTGMMQRMESMQMTGDFDIDFANVMSEHHQGGIEMAQIEVAQGKNEKIKAKAQEILTKQQAEQQELKSFVDMYKASGMKHGEGDLQKSMSEMSEKLKAMQISNDVDADFLNMMISHHKDGIAMSKLETKHGMSGK